MVVKNCFVSTQIDKSIYEKLKEIIHYSNMTMSDILRTLINNHYEYYVEDFNELFDIENSVQINGKNAMIIGARINLNEKNKLKEISEYYDTSISNLLRIFIMNYYKEELEDYERKTIFNPFRNEIKDKLHNHYGGLIKQVYLIGSKLIVVETTHNDLVDLLHTNFINYIEKTFDLNLRKIYTIGDNIYFDYEISSIACRSNYKWVEEKIILK